MEKINKFSLERMFSLTCKIVKEQPRVFMMRLLLLIGALTIGAVFIGFANASTLKYTNDYSIDIELAYFMVLLFVMGMVYTSLAFGKGSSKPGRISMLMLPAKSSEKYFSLFIIYIPVYLLMFALAMWIADAFRVLSLSIFYHEYIDNIQFLSFDNDLWSEIDNILCFFLICQSFYWLGSILWPHNSFIKTFAAMSILGTLYTVVAPLFYYMIIGEDNNICSVPWLDNMNPDKACVKWTFSGIVCAINYVIAYMRLRETDVIQRIL